MQLTQFTDIGLRTLMYASKHRGPNLITIAELSSQFEISHNHLIKVVNRVVKLGWLESIRGRNGGLRISVAPTSLSLGDIVRELEGSQSLIDCHKANCVLEGSCRLQGILYQAMQELYRWLDQYTLDDLVKKPTGAAIIKLQQHWAS